LAQLVNLKILSNKGKIMPIKSARNKGTTSPANPWFREEHLKAKIANKASEATAQQPNVTLTSLPSLISPPPDT
jgi:hypothetical protein